jgi:hypothetical protein
MLAAFFCLTAPVPHSPPPRPQRPSGKSGTYTCHDRPTSFVCLRLLFHHLNLLNYKIKYYYAPGGGVYLPFGSEIDASKIYLLTNEMHYFVPCMTLRTIILRVLPYSTVILYAWHKNITAACRFGDLCKYLLSPFHCHPAEFRSHSIFYTRHAPAPLSSILVSSPRNF